MLMLEENFLGLFSKLEVTKKCTYDILKFKMENQRNMKKFTTWWIQLENNHMFTY